jgi:hypothetical protein
MQGRTLPPDHPAAEELTLELDAALVTDQTDSCRSGTRITVGPGITGYQSDNTNQTTAADCFAAPPPDEMRAFWMNGGVCYQLYDYGSFTGAKDFMSRYGALWQHMLASFVPAPAESGGTTCS